VIGEFFFAPFSEFSFMRRALAGCLALSLGATPVGVFLMLRRMSLTGDAMAHAILPGAAVGFLFAGLSLQAMTLGGAVAGMAVALAAGFVSRNTVLREDASLAAFYLISLALGVLIVSTRGSNIDLMHLLFGTVLALNDDAIVLIAGIASLSLVVLATLYRPLVLECLEPAFLRSVSRLSPLTHHAFLTLVVINLVGGFHALGTLMSIGVMILPAAAAKFWARDISTLIGVAVGLALLGSYAGLLLSFHANLPTGSCIVLSIGALYVGSLLIGREGVLTNWYRSTRHLEA
jgi:zinc/manganese transport system permease protein